MAGASCTVLYYLHTVINETATTTTSYSGMDQVSSRQQQFGFSSVVCVGSSSLKKLVFVPYILRTTCLLAPFPDRLDAAMMKAVGRGEHT